MRWALSCLMIAGLLALPIGCSPDDSAGPSSASSGVAPPPPPPPGPGGAPGMGPQQPGAPGTVPPGMEQPPGDQWAGEGMEPGMPPGMGQPPGPGQGYPPGMGQPPGPGQAYPPGMERPPGDQWAGEGMEPGLPPGMGQPPRPGEAYPPGMGQPPGPGEAYPPGMGQPPGPGEAYPPGAEPAAPPATPEGLSMQNLKKLASAMQTYHAKGKRFPPAAYRASKEGEALLSWRVLLLPYLGQEALYRQFRFNEPWDSAHNTALAARMPDVYKTPGGPAENRTCYLAPIGPGTIFSQQEGMPMSAVRDGASNTVLVVEADADRAVVWTQPEDLRFIPAQPTAGLGNLRGDKFLAACADGSTRSVSTTLDGQVLRALFTASGGERIDPSRLEAGVGALPGAALLAQARRAFSGHRDKQAVAYLLADAVVRGDEEVLGTLRWSPGLKRPMLTTRWGVAIQTALSPEMLGALAGVAADLLGGQNPQGMPPGVERGFEGEGMPGVPPGRQGPGGEGPGRTAGNNPLQLWQAAIGQPMVERLQTRVAEGYFSDWFNQTAEAPATPQARPQGNFQGQPGMPPGVGMEGMGPEFQEGIPMEGPPGPVGMQQFPGGPPMEGPRQFPGPGMGPAGAKASGLPGFAMLGLAPDSDEALALAAKEEVDLLLLAVIRAKVARSRGQKQTSLTLRILNVENGDELWTSKSLTDTRVIGAERAGKAAADPVGDLLDDLLKYVDGNLRLVDMPPISPEVAQRRAAILSGKQYENPLQALVELRYYEWKKLLTPEELSEHYAKIVGPQDGPRLATGTEQERQAIVQQWLPKG